MPAGSEKFSYHAGMQFVNGADVNFLTPVRIIESAAAFCYIVGVVGTGFAALTALLAALIEEHQPGNLCPRSGRVAPGTAQGAPGQIEGQAGVGAVHTGCHMDVPFAGLPYRRPCRGTRIEAVSNMTSAITAVAICLGLKLLSACGTTASY